MTFWYYNNNKRSAVIDYRTGDGQAALIRLLADADICITTFGPPRMAPAGHEPRRRPRRLARPDRSSVTPFGLDGPWADWVSSDLVGLALGSPLNSCGYDDHSLPPDSARW